MPTERPGRPHAGSAVARFLERRINELRGLKTQREIAAAGQHNRTAFDCGDADAFAPLAVATVAIKKNSLSRLLGAMASVKDRNIFA